MFHRAVDILVGARVRPDAQAVPGALVELSDAEGQRTTGVYSPVVHNIDHVRMIAEGCKGSRAHNEIRGRKAVGIFLNKRRSSVDLPEEIRSRSVPPIRLGNGNGMAGRTGVIDSESGLGSPIVQVVQGNLPLSGSLGAHDFDHAVMLHPVGIHIFCHKTDNGIRLEVIRGAADLALHQDVRGTKKSLRTETGRLYLRNFPALRLHKRAGRVLANGRKHTVLISFGVQLKDVGFRRSLRLKKCGKKTPLRGAQTDDAGQGNCIKLIKRKSHSFLTSYSA